MAKKLLSAINDKTKKSLLLCSALSCTLVSLGILIDLVHRFERVAFLQEVGILSVEGEVGNGAYNEEDEEGCADDAENSLKIHFCIVLLFVPIFDFI